MDSFDGDADRCLAVDEKGNIKLKNMPKKTNTSIKNDDVFDITF